MLRSLQYNIVRLVHPKFRKSREKKDDKRIKIVFRIIEILFTKPVAKDEAEMSSDQTKSTEQISKKRKTLAQSGLR